MTKKSVLTILDHSAWAIKMNREKFSDIHALKTLQSTCCCCRSNSREKFLSGAEEEGALRLHQLETWIVRWISHRPPNFSSSSPTVKTCMPPAFKVLTYPENQSKYYKDFKGPNTNIAIRTLKNVQTWRAENHWWIGMIKTFPFLQRKVHWIEGYTIHGSSNLLLQ